MTFECAPKPPAHPRCVGGVGWGTTKLESTRHITDNEAGIYLASTWHRPVHLPGILKLASSWRMPGVYLATTWRRFCVYLASTLHLPGVSSGYLASTWHLPPPQKVLGGLEISAHIPCAKGIPWT